MTVPDDLQAASELERRVLPELDPRLVTPTHDDNFFAPPGRRRDLVRRVQLADVRDEIRGVAAL